MKTFKQHTLHAGIGRHRTHYPPHTIHTTDFHKKQKVNEILYDRTDPDALQPKIKQKTAYKTEDQLHNSLSGYYGTHADTLGGAELKDYTTASDFINSSLHDAHKKGLDVTNDHHNAQVFAARDPHFFGRVDDKLSSAEAKDTFHVYTGIKENPHDLRKKDTIRGMYAKARTPDSIHARLPAYTSTSISANVAKLHADRHNADGRGISHILKIEIPKGSKYGTYVGDHSTFSHEKEFLMRRNMDLHIDTDPEVINHGGVDYHIWHGKVLGFDWGKKEAQDKITPQADLQHTVATTLDKHIKSLTKDSKTVGSHMDLLEKVSRKPMDSDNIHRVIEHGNHLLTHHTNKGGDVSHYTNMMNVGLNSKMDHSHFDSIIHQNKKFNGVKSDNGAMLDLVKEDAKDAVMSNMHKHSPDYPRKKELEDSFS